MMTDGASRVTQSALPLPVESRASPPVPPLALPLVIEPELYRHFASRIIRRQRAECINALDRPLGREVQRRYTARLLDRNIQRVAVARDIERQINPFPLRDPRVDFIL